MLELAELTLAVSGNILIERASWRTGHGHRIGVVGRNGAGKSTLLRAIAGEFPVDSGILKIGTQERVGYLPQHAVSGSSRTLWDEAASGMLRVIAAKQELESAEEAVLLEEAEAELRLEAALERWRLVGGPSAAERVGEVLYGLGFGVEDWQKSCEQFSGGWQMRIALARLLLSEPTILLLDEPTNHLDMQARGWLSRFLAHYPHTVLIVSHDRHLLDEAVDQILEVIDGRLDSYSGNFTGWIRQKAERRAQALAAVEAQQRQIEHLNSYIDRFRYKATKASQAQSRIKTLEKMERVEAPEEEFIPKLRLPVPEASAAEPLELRKAVIGWPNRPPIFSGLNLILERGQRLVLLGLNGSGKSTLLSALAGKLPLQGGQRVMAKGVRIGYYTQDQARDLPGDLNGLEHVLDACPMASPASARSVLGALGLGGELALQKIQTMSGGEKARVALAVLALRAHEVLLMDEPTNHLDVVTVEVLVRALQDYVGALVVVTHDRFLVEQVATHVALLQGGKLEIHEGVREEDFEPATQKRGAKQEAGAGALVREEQQKQNKQLRAEKKRLAEVERLIEKAETRLGLIDAELCAPGVGHKRLAELGMEREAVEEELAGLMVEWEGLV
jgi:ATP-binding cassette subfamily F protein 3